MMKSLPALLLVVVSGAVRSNTVAAIGEENGLRLEVSTSQDVYSPSDTVRLRMRWTNLTDRSLTFPTDTPRLGNGWPGNPDGNVTHFAIEVLGSRSIEPEILADGPGSQWELKPREDREVLYSLGLFNGLSIPGHYRVRVVFLGYNEPGGPTNGWKGIIRGLEVPFEVKP